MNPNERTIWVAQLIQNEAAFFLRQTVYADHRGMLVAQAWRAQAYVEDCGRKGEQPDFTAVSNSWYQSLRLYHVRRSKMLDESVSLQEQDVREGDVLILSRADWTAALIRDQGVPASIDPEHTGGKASFTVILSNTVDRSNAINLMSHNNRVDVFISYARDDRSVAHALADLLRSEGLSVWWDKDLAVGQHFRRVIEEQLQAARTVIVVWSPHSVKSDWVIDEAEAAKKLDKLVPLVMTGCQPPLGFRGYHAIPITNVLDEREAILATVR